MPNWCNNNLTLTHSDPAMIQRAITAYQEGKLLQEFIPCPQELLDTTAQFGANDQEKFNREKYGYSSWYDFNVANWGTKWDIGGDGEFAELTTPNELELRFDSAWSPPIEAYARLLELGFEVYATYFEPGMCFAGIWDNGNDDYCDYGNSTPDEIRELYPELEAEFGIADMLEDMAADEEDIDERFAQLEEPGTEEQE